MLTATLFWSFGSVLGKSTHAHGVVVTFWRLWIAAIVLAALCRVTGRTPTLTDVRRCLWAGVLFGLNICVFFMALERLTVASTLVIASLAPVLMLPLAARLLGEQITRVKVFCAAVAVAGVVVSVVATPGAQGDGSKTVIGSVLAVGALVMWVIYLVLVKQVRTYVATLPFMFSITAVGAVAVSGLAIVIRPNLGEVHGAGWVWTTLLAVGPGIGGHGLLVWAQQRVDASVSTVLIQAEPVGASIAAYVILGERVGMVQGLAMLVVILALGALAYRESLQIEPTI